MLTRVEISFWLFQLSRVCVRAWMRVVCSCILLLFYSLRASADATLSYVHTRHLANRFLLTLTRLHEIYWYSCLIFFLFIVGLIFFFSSIFMFATATAMPSFCYFFRDFPRHNNNNNKNYGQRTRKKWRKRAGIVYVVLWRITSQAHYNYSGLIISYKLCAHNACVFFRIRFVILVRPRTLAFFHSLSLSALTIKHRARW